MAKQIVGLDIETYDPLLKTAGYSWKYNEGYILNTALYFEEEDRLEVIAGTHNKNCPFCEEDRIFQNRKIMGLLTGQIQNCRSGRSWTYRGNSDVLLGGYCNS